MKCYECGAEFVDSADPITETIKGIAVTVEGIHHLKCESCGEICLPSEATEALSYAFFAEKRRVEGLLSPEEIKAARKEHGLSQAEFEAVLGVSSPTVSRWETGKSVQTKTADNLIREFIDYPCVAFDMMQRAEIKPKKGVSYTVDKVCATKMSWKREVQNA